MARCVYFYFLFPSLSRAIGLTSRSRFLHTADELEPAIGKHKSDVDVLERKLEHAEAQSSRHKLAAIDAADKRETWCIEVSLFYLSYMSNLIDVFFLFKGCGVTSQVADGEGRPRRRGRVAQKGVG